MRFVIPQTEVPSRLSRNEFKLISGKEAAYFSDIHDHLVLVEEIADSRCNILNSSLEVYYSSIHTKTNEIIKY